MNVSPYLLLRRTTAAAISDRALDALGRWAADWAALPDHAVSCADACERPLELAASNGACRRTLANGGVVWVCAPADAARWLERQVFSLADGDSGAIGPASRLGNAVAASALDSLLASLVEAVTGQASAAAPFDPPPAQLLRRGAGSIVCTVQLGKRAVRLLVPAAALPGGVPAVRRNASAPRVTLHQALANVPVPLAAELCRAEMTLGYLRTLAVGDVLALPMAVDQPLRLTGPGDTTICQAHLGASDGVRAVELASRPAGGGTTNQSRK